MSIKENLLYTAEDSSLQESSALGSRAPLSLMRGWAVTAWPVELLILETSPKERVELPHANRASPGTRCAHVQVCREVLEERAWGRAGVAASWAQSLAWWRCLVQVTGDTVRSA